MTESQYVRANKKMFPVVMAQLAIMTLSSVIKCLMGVSIGTILCIVISILGMVVLNVAIKQKPETKECAMKLMGTGAAVYFVYMMLDHSSSVYAYAIPLMAASIIYLNVRFLYYGATVTVVAAVIHLIIMYVTGKEDSSMMVFGLLIIGIMIYVVKNVSETLTQFNEENLKVQQDANDKMTLVADNLVKHFDTVRDKMTSLSDVIHSNHESMTNIAESTGSTAEAIQEQAMMCNEIQKNTEAAEQETAKMIEKSNATMENVAEGARLVAGLKQQANNVEEASNVAAASTKQVNDRVEEVKGIVATILSISSQTNLLALNASIEAARAGEAGKGFAVVADEIRQLSEQTKDATNKITEIIKDLNTDAEKAMESMENSARSITEQNKMIDTTKDKFETIDAEMKSLLEVISSIEGVTKAIIESTNTISENISNLSATSEEIAASSTEGQQMAEGAVSEMSTVNTVIDATYMLAQDLRNFAK